MNVLTYLDLGSFLVCSIYDIRKIKVLVLPLLLSNKHQFHAVNLIHPIINALKFIIVGSC